jgi:uncharacterized protein DUF4331
MKKYLTLAALAALVGCNGGTTPTVTQPTNVIPSGNFIQIERLARPAVKEVFEAYNNHDTTNRVSPYGGDTQLASEIQSFETTVAGRAPTYGQTLAAILIPDELAADFTQAAPAAYLGVETGGATGSKWGGRKPIDDVVTISLGAIFGKTLSALGLLPDDGKSSPCLSTQNLTPSSQAQNGSTFPYLNPPN